MEALRIEILNPKVINILKDLASLKLITIKETINSEKEFKLLLKKLRNSSDSAPSLNEITNVVEEARTERYAKK